MKKLMTLLLLAILWGPDFSQGQCLVNVVPSNPWQWWSEAEFELYITNQNPIHQFVESPFFPNPSQNTNFLVPDPDDNNPSDGWELLWKRFGTLQNPIDVPSFALYNRFTGKFRVFAYDIQGENGDWETGYNKIEFMEGQETALFSHMITPTGSLDKFPKGLSSQTINRIYYGNAQWYFYEFTAAYDPCTCQSDVGLNVTALFSDIDQLDLSIIGTALLTPIISGNQPQGPNSYADYFTSLNKTFNKGQKIYKDANAFKSSLSGILNLLPIAANVPGAPKGGENAPVKSLPDWLKSIPKVGFIFSIASSLFGGGAADAKPVAYSAQYNLQATGQVQEQINYALEIVNTPGTIGGNNLQTHYNNILGVMNIVRTPVIYEAQSHEHIVYDECNVTDVSELAYQLKDPLQYIVNPASGLSATPIDLKVAIYFNHCRFNEDPNYIVDDSHIIPMPNRRGRTPYMPLDCLDEYTVKMGYQSITQNCKTTEIPLYSLMSGSPEYVHLIAVFKNPNGTGENIVYSAAYNFDKMLAPYSTSQTPVNPYGNFDESLVLDNLNQITSLGQQFYAWNEITVDLGSLPSNFNMIRLFTPNLTFTQNWQPVPGTFSDQFGSYYLFQSCKDQSKCSYIRHYYSFKPCPDTAPISAANLASFCNTTYKEQFPAPRNPALQGLTKSAETANITLFPNPAESGFNLDINLETERSFRVELFESTGRLVKNLLQETTITAGHRTLYFDIQDLPSGYYFVRCFIDDQPSTLKLIK